MAELKSTGSRLRRCDSSSVRGGRNCQSLPPARPACARFDAPPTASLLDPGESSMVEWGVEGRVVGEG